MIKTDIHIHTKHSHGKNSVYEMYEAAIKKDIEVLGFSEHSPRPLGYDYPMEYRDKLSEEFAVYEKDVLSLKNQTRILVLYGTEVDWLDNERKFIEHFLQAHNFDYKIGSVHFLDRWGFDASKKDWDSLTKDECYAFYKKYFYTMQNMINSGLFNIAGHFDIIKIFSVGIFHTWLALDESKDLVKETLRMLKDNNMALEVSSAGLRKACKEIYPCKKILKWASKLDIPLSFGSDAHNRKNLAEDFDKLESYVEKFECYKSFYYHENEWHEIKFTKKK